MRNSRLPRPRTYWTAVHGAGDDPPLNCLVFFAVAGLSEKPSTVIFVFSTLPAVRWRPHLSAFVACRFRTTTERRRPLDIQSARASSQQHPLLLVISLVLIDVNRYLLTYDVVSLRRIFTFFVTCLPSQSLVSGFYSLFTNAIQLVYNIQRQ